MTVAAKAAGKNRPISLPRDHKALSSCGICVENGFNAFNVTGVV